jgi:hypothetical protein
MYDPDDKTDEERELECELKDAIMQLHTQFCAVTAGSAEQRMVRRQMNGLRRGSELGGLLMEEYDMSAGRPHC